MLHYVNSLPAPVLHALTVLHLHIFNHHRPTLPEIFLNYFTINSPRTQLHRTKRSIAFVCFNFLYTFFFVFGYVCQINLTTLSFSVHVKLLYRIVSEYWATFTMRPSLVGRIKCCIPIRLSVRMSNVHLFHAFDLQYSKSENHRNFKFGKDMTWKRTTFEVKRSKGQRSRSLWTKM